MLPSLDFDSSRLTMDDLSNDHTSAVVSNQDETSTSFRIDDISTPNSDLRFTKPTPFQESRNFWKRSIAAHQMRIDATAGHSSTSSRRSHMIACTRRSASTDSTQSQLPASSDGDNDATICPQRLCRPSAIPVWPHLKQTRHRHSTPAMRLSNPKSPKRKLSTRVLGTPEPSISPKRVFLPRRVHNRGKIPFLRGSESDSRTSEDLTGIGENEILVKKEFEVYNEMAQPGENPVLEHNAFAQSMWNDPTEQQNFTSTWRDHQDGNTTKDAFLGKLAFETPAERQSKDLQMRGTLMRPFEPRASSLTSTALVSAIAKTKPTPTPPTPPTRRSSKDKGIHEAKSLHITRLRSRNELEGITEDQVLEDDIEETRPAVKQSVRMVSSIPVLTGSKLNLKNARSVESISQIEAMISAKSTEPTDLAGPCQSPPKRGAKQSRRPSKTMQPAGHPPERPLPELPVDLEESKRQGRLSASSTKHTYMVEHDATQFGGSPESVSTVEAPSPMTPTDESSLVNAMSNKNITGLSIHLAETAQEAPSTPIVARLDSSPFSDDGSPTVHVRVRPKKKKVSTDRSEKVRELKRKHMAAMCKGRVGSVSEEPESVEEAPSAHPDHSQLVSRCTQTVETMIGTSLFLPPPPPPPPLPAPPKYQSTFGTPTKVKKESVDELDQFPRVPLSRPGSRASVAPTIQSTRGGTRTNSPPRKSRSRGRTIQGRHSLNQDSKYFNKQPLSHSVIYINVDTDPTTSSFRASAISRSPSRSRRSRRASSPRKVAVDTKVTISPKTTLIKQKQSSRSLRSQCSTTKNAPRHGLERVSPVSFARPGSRHNPGLLSSDEDSEHADFIPKRVSSARPGSKSSNRSRASRKRKEHTIPQLPMTGQFAMEHVLMALAKCQNQGLDISLLSPVDVEKLAVQQKVEDELDSRAAKRLSMVQQRPQRPFSGRFDEASRLLKVKMKLPRPKSDISILTVTGTDTDASAHRLSDGYSSLDKRCSAGSLTDPTDMEIHDMKPIARPSQVQRNADNSRLVRTRRRPSSPTLSMKSFSYYQAQSHPRQPTIAKRASLMLMAPPIAPPRTTSRMQTDLASSSVSLASKTEVDRPASNYNETLDLDETGTSDPFMLGMLDGMASWTNPVVNENVWRTWGEEERTIGGNALFTPPGTAMASVCVP